jgi:uncharacterized membrane protein
LALAACALIYVFLFTAQAWDLHAGMRTHKADLGQIDQAVWNSSRGRFLAQTDNGFEITRLTDHVEPILVLISPLYWVWDDVQALLLLQVAAIAVGALLLYALAQRQFEKLLTPQERSQVWMTEPVQQLAQPLAFALGLAYLLAPPLQSAVLTDFHAAPLAVPLILWAFWAVDARRWGQFVCAALLTAAVKEEIALLAAALGVWGMWRALWEQQGRRALLPGLLVTVVALGWFAIATFVIVPANSAPIYATAESTYFRRYGALGDSALDIARSFFTQPQLVWRIASEGVRVAYVVGLLAAFGWLSVLGIEIVLLALPVLLANVLSAYPAQYYGEFHYSAPLMPFFAVAAAYGLGRLWRFLARRLDQSSPSFQYMPAGDTGTMTLAALVRNSRTSLRPIMTATLFVWLLVWAGMIYLQHGRGPLGGRYDPTPITAHHRLLDRFVAQLPAEAAVTATAAVHPHVSHRRYVYQFPLGLDAPVPADWALLDVTTNTDMAPGDLKARVDEMLAGDWGVVDAADGFLLLKKDAPGKAIPPDFYSFVRLDASAGDEKGETATLAAHDWPRWRETRLTVDYHVPAGSVPVQDEPHLDVITPAGDVVASLGTATPPGLVWLPADRWQPGETYRPTTLPLHLPRTFAVRAGGEPAVFRRVAGDRLVRLPPVPATWENLPDNLRPALLGPLRASGARLALSDGRELAVQAWVEERTTWPGDTLDLWLRWEGDEWPAGWTPFVHLRRASSNVAQQDGLPRLFGEYQVDDALRGQGFANDWRQLTLPPDVTPGDDLSLVMGLYNPETGERATVQDQNGKSIGNELVIGTVDVGAPPLPDQACALIPATCAAQNR